MIQIIDFRFISLLWKGLKKFPTLADTYMELNRKIEFVCRILHFILIRCTNVGVMLPPLLITAMNHFLCDLKEESYFLTCPVMWVSSMYSRVHKSRSKSIKFWFNICPSQATIQLAYTIRIFGGVVCTMCGYFFGAPQCVSHFMFHWRVMLLVYYHRSRCHQRFSIISSQRNIREQQS